MSNPEGMKRWREFWDRFNPHPGGFFGRLPEYAVGVGVGGSVLFGIFYLMEWVLRSIGRLPAR